VVLHCLLFDKFKRSLAEGDFVHDASSMNCPGNAITVPAWILSGRDDVNAVEMTRRHRRVDSSFEIKDQ